MAAVWFEMKSFIGQTEDNALVRAQPIVQKLQAQVQIAAAGPNFLARRDNDSSLYQLDANAVTGLREAAAGVQPPSPPNTKDGKKK